MCQLRYVPAVPLLSCERLFSVDSLKCEAECEGLPIVALFALCAVLLPRSAAGGRPIVIEVYAGERPSDADLLLGPVLSRLSRSGVDVLEAATQRVETQVSQTSAPSSDEAISSAVSQIDAGYNQFIKGRFDKAIEEIGAGLKVLRSSPVAIAQWPQLRDGSAMPLCAVDHTMTSQPTS